MADAANNEIDNLDRGIDNAKFFSEFGEGICKKFIVKLDNYFLFAG